MAGLVPFVVPISFGLMAMYLEWFHIGICISLFGSLYLMPDTLITMMEVWEPRMKWRAPTEKNNVKIKKGKKPRIAFSIDDVPYLGHLSGPRHAGESHFEEIFTTKRSIALALTLITLVGDSRYIQGV